MNLNLLWGAVSGKLCMSSDEVIGVAYVSSCQEPCPHRTHQFSYIVAETGSVSR